MQLAAALAALSLSGSKPSAEKPDTTTDQVLQDKMTIMKQEKEATEAYRAAKEASDKEEVEDNKPGEWHYHSEQDPMYGKTYEWINLVSDDRSEKLFLRHRRGQSSAFIELLSNSQFLCIHTGGIDTVGCRIKVRFDSGQVQVFTGVEADAGETRTLFIRPYDRFLTDLRKSTGFRIEATEFQRGDVVHLFSYDKPLAWK